MTREEQIYKKAEGDCIAMLESIERGDIIKGSICPQSYRAGFMDGAKWADSHPQWIPVEERLPEPHFADTSSDWVLICTTKGGISIDSYNHKHNEWCNNRTSVTHWMPLPQPPRKEE